MSKTVPLSIVVYMATYTPQPPSQAMTIEALEIVQTQINDARALEQRLLHERNRMIQAMLGINEVGERLMRYRPMIRATGLSREQLRKIADRPSL